VCVSVSVSGAIWLLYFRHFSHFIERWNMANSWEFFGAGKGKQVTGNWKLGAENW